MNRSLWAEMIVMSVRDPAEVARRLIALHLPREVLWTGLALAAVANTLLFSLSGMLMPGPAGFPPMFQTPFVYLGMVSGGLVLTVLMIHWAGRILGGTGRLEDVLVTVLWMQLLRVLVQAAALLLSLTIPLLAMLLVLVATVLGLFITLHFIDQAHRLNSLPRAGGALILSILMMAVALSVLLALFGGVFFGGVANV
ncbi:YIP1 family protein [Antarcticimicrobium luteum]|uniref:YIP1 family protein n=1 Tax=Antarcticimicrobium luteum TaxID=2547397 RepID=A0A4R5VFJ1_9RHOB|nr:YIP1 family protein [Antarcticimicrobium luteum]TDK51162.1 YIP1 family protein [Antarcticimicrobium luteum]